MVMGALLLEVAGGLLFTNQTATGTYFDGSVDDLNHILAYISSPSPSASTEA